MMQGIPMDIKQRLDIFTKALGHFASMPSNCSGSLGDGIFIQGDIDKALMSRLIVTCERLNLKCWLKGVNGGIRLVVSENESFQGDQLHSTLKLSCEFTLSRMIKEVTPDQVSHIEVYDSDFDLDVCMAELKVLEANIGRAEGETYYGDLMRISYLRNKIAKNTLGMLP